MKPHNKLKVHCAPKSEVMLTIVPRRHHRRRNTHTHFTMECVCTVATTWFRDIWIFLCIFRKINNWFDISSPYQFLRFSIIDTNNQVVVSLRDHPFKAFANFSWFFYPYPQPLVIFYYYPSVNFADILNGWPPNESLYWDQKYSRLRCLLGVKSSVICFYLGWSGHTLLIRKI